jgi:hypothetical protein
MATPSPKSAFFKPVAAGCALAALLAAPAFAEAPRTSEEAAQANLQGAILAPVRDLNLVRDEVPEVLTHARDAPYLEPQDASCEELAAMIAPLDAALGPESASDKPDASDMVFGAVADVTRDVIPFRGVIRRLTGAARQDRKVRETRQAGQLRRAYLKGFASAKNCYGPPQERLQVADAPPVAPPPIAPPPMTVPDAPPITVAALEPPAADPATPPPPPQPHFVLPESWTNQLAAGAGTY